MLTLLATVTCLTAPIAWPCAHSYVARLQASWAASVVCHCPGRWSDPSGLGSLTSNRGTSSAVAARPIGAVAWIANAVACINQSPMARIADAEQPSETSGSAARVVGQRNRSHRQHQERRCNSAARFLASSQQRAHAVPKQSQVAVHRCNLCVNPTPSSRLEHPLGEPATRCRSAYRALCTDCFQQGSGSSTCDAGLSRSFIWSPSRWPPQRRWHGVNAAARWVRRRPTSPGQPSSGSGEPAQPLPPAHGS